MKPDEAFFKIIETLKTQIPDAAQRSTAAMQIFGQKFGQNTALLNEDIGALRENFKQLGGGMTTEFAQAADVYGDAWTDITQVQDNFKNQIAGAVLPALTSLLQDFPKLGGAVLTFGSGLVGMADKFVPLITNIALLKGSGLLTWVKTSTAAIPGLTAVTNLFAISVRGLMAAFGPVTLAIGAAFLAWEAWKGANAESGWLRDLSDGVENLALRLMGFSAAQADAAIKADHLRQKTAELAEEQRKLRQAQAVDYTEVYIGTQTELAEAVAKVSAEYKALLASDRLPAVRAALQQNVLSMEGIARMGDTTTDAVKQLKASMDDLAKAAEQAPLAKFREEMQAFAEELRLATRGRAPAAAMLEAFGAQAQKARTQALLIPGGLRAITDEMLALAEAADLKDLNLMLDEFHKTTLKVAAAWTKEMKAAAQAWADFTGKQLTEAIVNISTIETSVHGESESRLRETLRPIRSRRSQRDCHRDASTRRL